MEMTRHFRSARALAAVVAVLALTGCVTRGPDGLPVAQEIPGPSPLRDTLHPTEARWSDRARVDDLRVFQRLAADLAKLPAESSARQAGDLYLEAARTAYLRDPQTGWIDEALARARRALQENEGEARAALWWWASSTFETSGLDTAWPLFQRYEALPVVADGTAGTFAHIMSGPPAGRLAAQQHRLGQLRLSAGAIVDSFALARAKAWLDFAADARGRGDHSGVAAAATDRAEAILDQWSREGSAAGLRAATALLDDTPAAARVRYDLWQLAERERRELTADNLATYSPRLATLARLEVVLLQADHEYQQRGLPAARPYLELAERLAAALNPAP